MQCTKCRHDNPEKARFCNECGAPLAERDAPAADPGERRQATIVFADLSGYTALNERLDPEEVDAIMARIKREAAALVEAHGGTVNQFVGDEVVALFGVPRAHRDDPQRAVRAALALHEAVRAIGEEVAPRIGRRLCMHSGINSGLLVTRASDQRDGHYALTGDMVNTGARLLGLAGEDEVVVGPETWRQVSGAFEAEARAPVPVRGKAEPIVPRRILRERAAGALRPLVGRDAEREAILAAARECLEQNAARIVLLRGEAGIGKSRLLAELRAVAARLGFACHLGQVLDFGQARGRAALRSLVEGLLGVPPRCGPADRALAIRESIESGLATPAQEPFLYDLLDAPMPAALRAVYGAMDPATREAREVDALAALAAGAASRMPLALCVEDVHWAEAPALARLEAMAAASRTRPFLLAVTARPESRAFEAMEAVPCLAFDLGPLAPEAARAFAARFASLVPSLVDVCIERSAGHPLFLEQLLLSAGESAQAALPGSVQALVLSRLDHLAPEDKALLQAASVLGQRFDPAALAHVLSRTACELDSLAAAGLVTLEGGDCRFAHALIRDGAYESLLKARRREYHLRAAGWYASRNPALRAEHLDKAESPEAAGAYLEAARAEAERFHVERTLALAERGVAVAAPGTEARHALLCLQGQSLLDHGRGAAARAPFAEALDTASDDPQRVHALLGLAAVKRMTDQVPAALARLDEAEPLAERAGLARERSRLHHLRGNLYFPLGRTQDCTAQHRLALDWARRAASPADEAAALGGLGDAYFLEGKLYSALEQFERCVVVSREQGLGRTLAANIPMVAICALLLGEIPRGEAAAREALEITDRSGSWRAKIIALHARFWMNVLYLEDLPQATSEASAARELSRQIGAKRFEAESLGFLAHARWRAGVREEALAIAREGLSICRDANAMSYTGPLLLAELALATPDPREGAAALAEGERLLAAGSPCFSYYWFYDIAIEVALRASDWDAAERHAAALERYTAEERPPPSALVIRRARALAAHGRGKRDAALRLELESVRGAAAAMPYRPLIPALDAAIAA